jgi:nucleoside-diphosphate-sugar epimerase
MDAFMAVKNSGINRMNQICIVGIGWLGKQLIDSLSNFKLIGLNRSTYSDLKIPQLKFDIGSIVDWRVLPESLINVELFIITIPPSSSDNYAKCLGHFLKLILKNESKVIYTSSTSVYGNSIGVISESTIVMPQSENAKQIVEVEKIIQSEFGTNGVVLRLGGLIGPGRHPVNSMVKKTYLKGGNLEVNLIHSIDIICFIRQLIFSWNGGVFNLAHPDHPIKKEYYTWYAKECGLNISPFEENDSSKGKIIDSNKLKALKFEFQFLKLNEYPKN